MPDVIDKVLHFISGDNEATSDKDILLKQTAKEIAQNKYAKFYRVKQGEVDVVFAQYIFNVYRAIYPLQAFLQDSAKETKIKQVTLEAFLDPAVKEKIKQLSGDLITERKKSAGDDFSKQLEEEIASLAVDFDSPKIAQADECYNLITAMRQFVLYNFATLLREFDPEIQDGDFLTAPKFSEVEAAFLLPNIKEFLSILPLLEENKNWKIVFEILKYCNGGKDLIPLTHWISLIASLKDLQSSGILTMIGKLAAGNPIWEAKSVAIPNEALSASWLEQKTSEVQAVISGIAENQKATQIYALVNAVFGTTEITRLNYYIPAKENILLDKGLTGFTYAQAINHLQAFIQDFVEKEIHELCDIMLVRGQWINAASSRAMSGGFHSVLDTSKAILELDEKMDDNLGIGARIRTALLRVDRDKSQGRYINNITETINDEALEIITGVIPHLIILGKHFKLLMDDCPKKMFEVIMNWKELNALPAKAPLLQRLTDAYKRVNYFVQLMLLEGKPSEQDEA